MFKGSKFIAFLSLALIAAELLLALSSWLVVAIAPEASIHSLLSGEGIRWMAGHFVDTASSPLLVWMVLLSLAWGGFRQCGIVSDLRTAKSLSFWQRFAFQVVAVELVVIVGVLIALVAVPHAALLGVTGSLTHSSFMAGVVPMLALGLAILSASYGLASGHLRDIGAVTLALVSGIRAAAPLFLIYVLAAFFYHTLLFVL